MRLTTIAALAALLVVLAGCQDSEARYQAARLQEQLDAMKKGGGSGSDDLLKAMLLKQDGDGSRALEELRKNMAAMSGDVTTGFKSLNKDFSDLSSDQRKRTDALETKLDKVKELETSLVALKGMVETLEKTVKSVDPNQVLDINKQLLQVQADLRAEQLARQQAEGRATAAENAKKDADDKLAAANAQIELLKGGKYTDFPEYKKLQADFAALKDKLGKSDTDYKALDELCRRLKASNDLMRKQIEDLGAKPPADDIGNLPPVKPKDPTPTVNRDKYDFEGTVRLVKSGDRPNAATLVLVDIGTGEIPPENSELLILNDKKEQICRLRVTKHYRSTTEPNKVDQIGGTTLDENPTKPVVVGDKVVWVKSGATQPEKAGSASGN